MKIPFLEFNEPGSKDKNVVNFARAASFPVSNRSDSAS